MSIWRRKEPEKPAVHLMKTELVEGATYHIHKASNLAQAMTFLRRTPVTEPSVYMVVETPQGNIGRDFIYIFHEPAGTPIEHGPRPPLPEPVASSTHCAWCGFYVGPFDVSQMPGSATTFALHLTVDDILNNGGGFWCKPCDLLQCCWCSGLTTSSGEREARCRSCGTAMHSHVTLPPVTPWTIVLQVFAADGQWKTLADPRSRSRVPMFCAVVHAARDRLADVAREQVFDKTQRLELPRRVVFLEGELTSEMSFSEAYGVIEEGSTEVRPYTTAPPSQRHHPTGDSLPIPMHRPPTAELINELIAIGRAEGALLAPRDSELRTRIQAVGARPYHAGGQELMLQAHAAVVQSLGPVRARELEAAWDGVGSWHG